MAITRHQLTSGVATVTTVTITTSPTLVSASNFNRVDLALYNGSAQVIYIGYDTNLTTANGWPLAVEEKESDDTYVGPVYAVVAATTAALTVRAK